MGTVEHRPYETERHREAADRIRGEVGWLEPGREEAWERYTLCGRARVVEVDGSAECLASSAPGTIRYLERELPFACVTAVMTSRVARKQGLAQAATARLIAEDAAAGALVAGLGIFEQGFYDRLGFGTSAYHHSVSFDPAHLKVRGRPRPPQRVTVEDFEAAHAARLARRRSHGSCNLTPPEVTWFEMGHESGFGLGYFDGPHGEPSHYLWCSAQGEHGPYSVRWSVFRSPEQFVELMGVLRVLGDQVRLVRLQEPPGIQLQDVLTHPLRDRIARQGSRFEAGVRSGAYYQFRVLDVPGCLAGTSLPGSEVVRFSLELADPVEGFLPPESPWRGVAGQYVVTLGPSSGAERGHEAALPTLTATVGAFTRLWLGVRPATGLSFTDELSGPPELLARLDEVLRLPPPVPDWDF